MENIIYNELLVRGHNVDVEIVDYTSKNEERKRIAIYSEVDFVCTMGNKRYYIQSTFAIPDKEKTDKRLFLLITSAISSKKSLS